MDKKFGFFAIGANMFICLIIGLLIYNGWGNFEILNEYSVETWIAVSSNLIVLSITSVLIIPVLFRGLESALKQENKLRSDLEETNQLLEAKNRELENFAYTASHDLKEPLRMIRSFMELLEKKYGPQLDEKANGYIHYAVDGARRMTDSLNALLEYSRIGRIYDQQENVDMNSILDEVKKTLQADIEKMNAQITASNLPEIAAVPVSMKILLQNLISNALKYQNKEFSVPPSITITHSEDQEQWTFSVKDNGIGIEPKYRDQIFEMFKRLHGRQDYEGNGIGLALCKKVVEQHDGNIWVESEPDKGSTFHFTIKKIEGS
jgi:light-regulated signal transduction histidine kinase (bacteriophytochrome)